VRKWAEQATGDVLTPPPDDLVCFVEDWIEEDVIDSHTFTPGCRAPGHAGGGHADCELHLERLAAARHGEDRAAWLDQHGVPKWQECAVWPVGRARWRTAA
jgi:hypothetical protein